MYSVSDGSHYEKRIDAKGRVLSDECIEDEIPFEVPAGWEWVRMRTVLRKLTDGSHNPPPKQDAGYPVISAINIKNRRVDLDLTIRYCDEEGFAKENPRTDICSGDIILGIIGGSIGNVGIFTSEKKVIAQRSVAVIDSFNCNDYLSYALESPLFFGYYKDASGTAQGGIYLGLLGEMFLPFPPLAEQHRIAERVEELMPLVDEYGALEKARKALDSELPERLCKSVLRQAVQGQLVPQDPSDEPASVLLERIREERTKLVAEKKAKFPKGGESVIYRASDGGYYEKRIDAKGCLLSEECIDDEIPFEIPESWEWARLGNLLSVVSDGTHKTPDYKDEGVLFLSVQNISKGYFDLDKVKYISQETHAELCKRVKPQNGDILLCRIGTLGKPIIVNVDYEFSIFVSLGLLRPIKHELAEWIVACIDSPLGLDWIEAIKVGGGTHTFKINLGDIPLFLIPVAPLAEQQRIVDRYNQLSMLL